MQPQFKNHILHFSVIRRVRVVPSVVFEPPALSAVLSPVLSPALSRLDGLLSLVTTLQPFAETKRNKSLDKILQKCGFK